MNKGLFVTIEGPDGSGKSSIVEMLKEYLNDSNKDYIITREPGGINIAEQIRDVILNKENTDMDARTEALLYAASRRQHMAQRVIPALKEGKIVICDRFVDSSLAYQGHARGIGIDDVMNINEFAIDGYMPNLTIYLDVSPEIGLERIALNKDREVNRLDLEKLGFHKKVRDGYYILLDKYPQRIKKVDASKTIDKVFEEVKSILESAI